MRIHRRLRQPLLQVRAAAVLALILCLSGGFIKAFEINPKDPIPDCARLRAFLRDTFIYHTPEFCFNCNALCLMGFLFVNKIAMI